MTSDLSFLHALLAYPPARLPALPPAAQAFLGVSLLRNTSQPQLWLADPWQIGDQLADCFRTLAPEIPVFTLPLSDPSDMEACGQQLKTLSFLQNPATNAAPFVLIAPRHALHELFVNVAPQLWNRGDSIAPDELFQSLEQQGYALQVEVYERGEAARRGGVLDVWPPALPLPVRIEFLGDEIESLRTFDPETQRSVESIDRLELVPLRTAANTPLSAWLPANTLRIFSSTEPPDEAHAIHLGALTTNTIPIDLAEYDPGLRAVSELHRPEQAERQRALFFQGLEERVATGWTVEIFMETPGALERLREAFFSHPNARVPHLRLGLLHGSFLRERARQIVLTEADIYGYAPKPAHVRRGQARNLPSGVRLAEWSDLQPGELVVHADHGIGKYLGLVEMDMAGRRQEMLLLEYASSARLYLPTGQAHLLTRYVGMGNSAPALHSLKGARWQNERASAQAAIEDLAANLLETQAERALRKGRACGPDTPWQAEFENSFPYLETPDQLRAIREVKSDLESPRPMDRLICGDAGYGKTEVAMRAAFKMVMEVRQVAVLVPTTILAQQHFDTFTERMAAFPVRIEMLSRFCSRHAQNETLRRLREGTAQIVIGTHRLVSGDVQFKELGLVIIDEEQRFGVRAKEHLKQLRRQVDVLTLSATPIPRTLYMGLTGARDMSTIQTPPQERQPVETIVLEYHDDIVREAILHELARDGQVFYLHNRVQTIAQTAQTVQALVPSARVKYAHGQMDEEELSDVMHCFVHGEFDVLVCTTIIESGVDIPRVNTILVDHADRFGLADLYQLRGRVGRARQKAYAFLLLSPGGALTDDSRRRIEALKRYTGHGTGFRIAMRDLEIRGAGNLLGAQQSGHIAAIGFDLYCQLLRRSIARLQGKRPPPVIDAAVDLDFILRAPSEGNSAAAALIPYGYVDDENLRVRLYARLAALTSEGDVRELKKEFSDRFGAPPTAVKNLFEIARLRIAASRAGIQSVRADKDRLILLRSGEAIMPDGRYPRLTARTPTARIKEILALLKKLPAREAL
jgi:transcription-repair coupling factor (superfamily II helicase)